MLKDRSLLCDSVRIGEGIYEAGVEGLTVTNPATSACLGNVPNLGSAETELAIRHAREAQADWAAQPAKVRARCFSAGLR